jgi:TATA-box binding protein (TBP) (component of TFIID and TFIIIB)
MQPQFNTTHSDLVGTAAIKFANGITLDDFCAEHFANYNKERYKAVAIRLFEGNETVVTVYAVDKMHQFGDNGDAGKIPAKKFKIDFLKVQDIFRYCETFNCTLTVDDFPVEELDVINV